MIVDTIIEDFKLPVSWGDFYVDLEVTGTYRAAGEVPGYAAGGYTRYYEEYELESAELRIACNSQVGELDYNKMSADEKAIIKKALEDARDD